MRPLHTKSFGTQDTGTVRAVVSAFTTKNDVVYFANAVSRISKNNKQKKQFKKVAINNKSMLE